MTSDNWKVILRTIEGFILGFVDAHNIPKYELMYNIQKNQKEITEILENIKNGAPIRLRSGTELGIYDSIEIPYNAFKKQLDTNQRDWKK